MRDHLLNVTLGQTLMLIGETSQWAIDQRVLRFGRTAPTAPGGSMLALVRRHLPLLIVVVLVVSHVHAQQPQPGSSFRLIRVTAGPRGSNVGGEFKLEQERATFSRSSDTQIVVQFQWDGAPGLHRLGARWRSPSGALSISEIEYTAPSRVFGAVWTLPITPSMPVGLWSIEATIDGLPSGSFQFEIVDTAPPAATPPPLAKRSLTPAELYANLENVYVSVERYAARSGLIDRNGGFILGPSSILTVFSALDGADRLELVAKGGVRQPIETLGAWDRRRDYAVISTDTRGVAPLPVASGDPPKVGDRCYSMESGAAGQRVLAECLVVGRAGAEEGLVVQFHSGRSVPGAPVLNEFGEVVGLIAGHPPASFRGMTVFRVGGDPGARVVPFESVRPHANAAATSVDTLRSRNVLIAAVDGRDNILSAGFAGNVQRNQMRPIDQRDQFSINEARLFVFLTWDAKERVRGVMAFRLFDEENRNILESKPRKVDLKPGTGTFSQWEVAVPKTPGTYRVDVVVNDLTMWRGGFRVTP